MSEAGNTFTNYPHALYATDVKFQQAYRPSGRFTEQKVYFSAKHNLYGFKIECSVAPPGVAVDVFDHSPGSNYAFPSTARCYARRTCRLVK
ncbi:hypothetical protein PC129_g21573 [Phytophthora cactorum]|uniref:DDE Tnp4 domain-containing protein n=1 Tax=Phytophthora cactorum TaxID=29920 RepID=A0A329RBI3_9STRA|nr:hypothetical protein Pcac1_g2231 [Phytophthora cactorum]KAG2796316.1 hypothetical protein PC112_g22263 [Phytophthora cactorum]KAG2890163.1 hypothetical protein PC117_g24529 [Phytophthora cactorum]KAG2961200.1 hypothetical protein PC118_g22098 [Phytophthora cactorum]KAG3002305.1 hypothetical protein PC120_g19801 [Phytophthora cactorum]